MEIISAVNPLAGLSPNKRKRIMNNLYSNSNSNSNKNSTQTTLSFFRNSTRKKNSPRNSVFARNPFPGKSYLNLNSNSNSNSEEVEVQEKPEVEEKIIFEPYVPSPAGLAFKHAVLNRIKQKEAERAVEKARTNQRKQYVSKYAPVFAVNPMASPQTKAYIEKLKKNYANRTQSKPKKQVTFSSNTKLRKTRKLPKNCKTRKSRS